MKAPLIVSLIAVAGLSVYSYSLYSDLEVKTLAAESCSAELERCKSDLAAIEATTKGYAPSVVLTDDSAYTYAVQFKDAYGSTCDHITGGVFTKDAFTALFTNPDVNAVAYAIGLDATGRVIPGKAKGLFVLLSGVNMVEISPGVWEAKAVSVSKYAPNNWCPVNCLQYLIHTADGRTELR
ncbi:MAG TPA: hypothetical protein VFW78_06960 [Bacteroidia bacterium]|nr:hypothetical protein [Bacteroidia bacterium]